MRQIKNIVFPIKKLFEEDFAMIEDFDIEKCQVENSMDL
jgi:hypothetical protein